MSYHSCAIVAGAVNFGGKIAGVMFFDSQEAPTETLK